MEGDLKTKAAFGVAWMFAQQVLAQLVSFIVSIVLARILLPEDYGVVALLLIFINIANVFVTSGLGQALVQNKDATELDFNTIFIVGSILAWLLYVFLYVMSPFISEFYNKSILVPVLRVISLKLPIASINSIQNAYISRRLQFKKLFLPTLIGTSFSGVVGIVMALLDFGVWALVAQYLLNSIISTIFLFMTIDWRPRFQFSYNSAKKHLGFGIKLTASSLINVTYLELQSLAIGKFYTSSDLGLFKRGYQFPALVVNNINSSISSVMFPTFSKVSHDINRLKLMTQRTMSITSFIITPIMLGMIAVAKQLVLVVLTDKWIGCVFFLQTACLIYMLLPIQTANCQAILAMGRSDVYLKQEVLKKTFGVTALIFALQKGINAIAISAVIAVIFSAIVSIYPNKHLLNYSLKEQLQDLFPSYAISVIMFICVYCVGHYNCHSFILLCIQMFVGFCVYIGLSYLFKVNSLLYLTDFFKRHKGTFS